jgi:hypothetical protein
MNIKTVTWSFENVILYKYSIEWMITFTEILACNGTVIYDVIGNQMNFFTSGRLQVLLAYDGMLLLKLNEF